MAKAIFQSIELYFSFFMSYLFVIGKHTFIALIAELTMRRHLIFLFFIVMVFILAIVVKIENDQKKRQELSKLELVKKKVN
ncbi:hypothetical protein CU320_13845 [Acinetobacter pseudolwoffii]|jgi:succinate-acetate transporter protein|uniref:Uncharacterized protein n=1 Tax=Acinetobacter pseudolwoffii TaxID=2053287 RepID=A0A2H9UII2_9GAMM|nr:hypothetical protein CU320_13845 [Acinetobacter pseudolwoffii]